MALALLIGVSVFCAARLQGFMFCQEEHFRFGALVISLCPILFVYAAVRVMSPPLLSAAMVSSVVYLLSKVSQVKDFLTGEPLSWTDLSSGTNLSVIPHYITLGNVLLLLFFALVLLVLIKINPFRGYSKPGLAVKVVTCLALFPFAFYPYCTGKLKAVNPLVGKAGISYIVWDWRYNVQLNGLAMHLVQTSRRVVPRTPDENDRKQFAALTEAGSQPVADRPKNIIFILCEACWYDERHFKEAFAPLDETGLKPFRTVSPSYGGGTVNAAFELLTGLSSKEVFTGIIYQEYASLMSDTAWAYPRSLKRLGYTTISEHNHNRKFWKRDVVNPKLGFDEFLGIEDMGYDGPAWAEDAVLFDSAFENIRRDDSPKYLFLTTVHTHGAYMEDNGDYGAGDYERRLSKTLSQLSGFVEKVLACEPDTLIVMVGDHKPALAQYFYEKGVFPKEYYASTGSSGADFRFGNIPTEAIGDVPGFIYWKNPEQVDAFVERVNGKPFYCLSQALDSEFVGAGLPAYTYAANQHMCDEFDWARQRTPAKKTFPDWLYSLSLLR
jgi:hypothetical protein